jgi:hypothetical protein
MPDDAFWAVDYAFCIIAGAFWEAEGVPSISEDAFRLVEDVLSMPDDAFCMLGDAFCIIEDIFWQMRGVPGIIGGGLGILKVGSRRECDVAACRCSAPSWLGCVCRFTPCVVLGWCLSPVWNSAKANGQLTNAPMRCAGYEVDVLALAF